MSRVYHKSNIPYVESQSTTAPLPSTPTSSSFTNWPTPSTQPRLTNHFTRSQDGRRARAASYSTPQLQQDLPMYVSADAHAWTQQKQSHSTYYTPTQQLQPAQHSPTAFHTPQLRYSPTSYHQTYTPPTTIEAPNSKESVNMTQRRLSSHGQRPVMGPPETPSRGVIPHSPGLFPNVEFSPGLFSQQVATPQSSGSIIPQQRLFWDPSTATPIHGTPQQFHTPTAFPDDFNNSFNSNSTIVPQNFNNSLQEQPYDLPTMNDDMSTSFMDGSVFPAPFQTSPRPVPPPMENPTQFLSSPARRFGGDTHTEKATVRRKMPDLPAYHHQMQESKREREMIARERRRSRNQTRPSDEDMVMSSVRRALSPRKTSRPSLSRSVTLSGLPPLVRRSSSNFDNVSIGSSVSSRSIRERNSSPIRRPRDTSRRSSASAVIRRKTSLTLEIDNFGIARTVMNSLPENIDEEMNDDDAMTDELSSEDGNDQHMLYSFSGNSHGSNDLLESSGDARDELRTNSYLSMGSDRIARISQRPPLGLFDATSTIRRARGETLTISNNDVSNNPQHAQQALRAMMLDRSRSASSHASSSSMQFHSSPPLQQSHLAGYNASPTTITDPGLATPSTDADSVGSAGTTRCVCNSAPPDGNIMIQCDACSKWLHAKCVGLNNRTIPDVYICPFCSDNTPLRGGTVRATNMRQPAFQQSPLAHKSGRRLR